MANAKSILGKIMSDRNRFSRNMHDNYSISSQGQELDEGPKHVCKYCNKDCGSSNQKYKHEKVCKYKN